MDSKRFSKTVPSAMMVHWCIRVFTFTIVVSKKPIKHINSIRNFGRQAPLDLDPFRGFCCCGVASVFFIFFFDDL